MDIANQYVDENKPWELAKDATQKDRLQVVCSAAIRAFVMLTIYLKPVLPNLARRVETDLLGLEQSLDWAAISKCRLDRILPYKHLMSRIDPHQTAALIEAGKVSLTPTINQPHSPQQHAQHQENIIETITPPLPSVSMNLLKLIYASRGSSTPNWWRAQTSCLNLRWTLAPNNAPSLRE